MGCQGLAVPTEVMHHVVRVESSYNPYAIGVVGGRLVRQPKNLPEALATVRMLVGRGFNFSIGLAQVNRYNLDKYGLDSYEQAFEPCANLKAGSRILAECYQRAKGDWGKSFSCYYSGNFSTGFRHGYVQKIYASVRQTREDEAATGTPSIEVVGRAAKRGVPVAKYALHSVTPTNDQSETLVQNIPQKQNAVVPPSRSQPVPSRIVSVDPVASFLAAGPVSGGLASIGLDTQGFASQRPAAQWVASQGSAPQPTGTEPVATVTTQSAGPIGRVVPTAGVAGVANVTAAEPVSTGEVPVVKRRGSLSDKAFVVTDLDGDEAFVF